jgi:hypothetical protein
VQTLLFDESPHFTAIGSAGSIFVNASPCFCVDAALLDDCPVFVGKFRICTARGGRIRITVFNPFVLVIHLARNHATATTDALCQIYEYTLRHRKTSKNQTVNNATVDYTRKI